MPRAGGASSIPEWQESYWGRDRRLVLRILGRPVKPGDDTDE